MTQPKVLVVGAGGVGVIAALSLTLNNKSNVTLVVRSDYDQVQETGYTIDSVSYGKHEGFRPHNVAKTVTEAAEKYGPFDYIALTTKNIPDGAITCEDIVAPAVTDGKTTIILIQNGIGIDVPMVARFPQNVILSGVSLIGSTNMGKGVIHNSHSDSISLGLFANPNVENYETLAMTKVKEFQDIYQNSDPSKNSIVIDKNVTETRWRKLVYNSALNTITTLVELDVNRCQINHANQRLFGPAMDEVIAIAASEGVSIDKSTKHMFQHIGDGLFYSPSMLVDRRKKQLFELEIILGNPLKIAKKNGVDTPVLNVLYALLVMIQFKIKEETGLIKINEADFKGVNSDDYPEFVQNQQSQK